MGESLKTVGTFATANTPKTSMMAIRESSICARLKVLNLNGLSLAFGMRYDPSS